MFIERLKFYNNTIIIITLTCHTYHIYTIILKCINNNLKKNSKNLSTFIQLFFFTNYALRMLLHQAQILLNNDVADFTIPSLMNCLNLEFYF